MRSAAPWILLVSVVSGGCTTNVAGQWAGTCALSSTSYSANIDVIADVFTDNGFEIEGEMSVADWQGSTRTGQMFGNRTGRFVLMVGQFRSELGLYEMEIDAQRVSRGRIDGDCFFRIDESDGELFGTIEMGR